MGACTAFIFAALIEFTVVNYLSRKENRGRGGRGGRGYIEDARLQRSRSPGGGEMNQHVSPNRKSQ